MAFVHKPVVSLPPTLGVHTLFWNRPWLLESICKVLPLITTRYKFSLFFKAQAQHKSSTEATLGCAGKVPDPCLCKGGGEIITKKHGS